MKAHKLALSFGFAVMLAAGVTACADENDPKTWVKRLDDPTQRTPAVKRLSQFFEDTMAKSGQNRDDKDVKALLDVIVTPLTQQYTAGTLDEKTRKELIKTLSDMGDARSAPAFTKAFNDFEPGKNDEDVKFAAQATGRLGATGKLSDEALVGALWGCFAKFQPSKSKSINLVTDLHDAVLAVKSPSYGPKAVEKLAAKVTNPKAPDEGLDQIQFWQLTSVQLVSELKFTPAVKPLVTVLMTPTKADLRAPVRTALLRMAKDAEPQLIAAVKGTDPDYAELAKQFPGKEHLGVLSESLGFISRPASRDALLEVLANADTDQNRTLVAMNLVHVPADPKIEEAYLAAYAKIQPNAAIALMGGANGHAILAQASSHFFDPKFTDWVLKEIGNAKGEAADAMPPAALDAAIKLMTSSQVKAVGDAVAKDQSAQLEKEKFKNASQVVEKCKEDAGCYASFLDQPIPSTPDTAKYGAIKAAWMAGIYGKDDTRKSLLEKLDKVKDGAVRLAIVEAIDHLTPKGDVATADAIDKIVDADKKSGNKALIAADDSLTKVSLKLRSRAAP